MSSPAAPESQHDVFIGSYTRTTSLGIYACRLAAGDGALTPPVHVAALANPTWLTLHPEGRVLYANTELKRPDGTGAGAMSAYAIDPAKLQLTLLNTEPTADTLSHHAVDSTGRVLVAASYGGGQVSSFPLLPDGRLGPRRSFITHHGPLGPNPKRQDRPHPHSITLSPDNRFAFVADLGLDRVDCYALDLAAATLTPAAAPLTALPPGTGPRHAKFSRDGRHFYIIGELNNTVTVCAYHAATGGLDPRQTIPTLPGNYSGESIAAEIRLHPNGRFLYGSNRGHDSLAVFEINPDSGTLSLVEIVPCGGIHPRNFALTPDGAWLVCAHQGTDSLVSFRVDPSSGRLSAGPGKIAVAQPVCVLFR